jgi:hypothetical protein
MAGDEQVPAIFDLQGQCENRLGIESQRQKKEDELAAAYSPTPLPGQYHPRS